MNDASKNGTPPGWIFRFLRLFVPVGLYEGIEGDLLEQYEIDFRRVGAKAANRSLVKNTLRFFRPGILLRNVISISFSSAPMMMSYFKSAYRKLASNKVFAFVNLLGLTLGMTAFVLIFQYVRFEWSFDQYHNRAEDIYRIATKAYLEQDLFKHETYTFQGISEATRTQLPEIDLSTTFYTFDTDENVVKTEGADNRLQRVVNKKGIWADKNFLELFSFPLLEGNRQALREPLTAVVSESMSRDYFNNDAMGRIIEVQDFEGNKRYRVTGIIKDVPENSHLKFDFLIAQRPSGESSFWDWTDPTYVRLKDGVEPAFIEQKLDTILDRQKKADQKQEDNRVFRADLQPLTSIHLYSHLEDELGANGNGYLVNGLFVMAIFILIVAWINFINLSTSISITRVRETGVRKVMGASRLGLMLQVMTEAGLLNALSVMTALLLVYLMAPYFGFVIGVPGAELLRFRENEWPYIPLFLLISSFLAGWYPAKVISSYLPVKALKGNVQQHGLSLRKGLVIFQFSISIALIIVMISGYQQLNSWKDSNLGFNLDQVMVIKAYNFDQEHWSDSVGGYYVDVAYASKALAFEKSLTDHSSIQSVTALSHLPGQMPNWGTEFKSSVDPTKSQNLRAIGVDYPFFETLEIPFLAGRNFSPDFPSDRGNESKRAVILNETASRQLGFASPEAAIHQHITSYWGADYEVIGVVASYRQLSPKEFSTPIYFILQPRALSYFAVRVVGDTENAIEGIDQQWSRFFPDCPFDYFFLDAYYNRQYAGDQKFVVVMSWFMGLGVVIALLGLFGLTSYAVVQRTKEVGIRKVLGASASEVLLLFSGGFTGLILISGAIAIPLTYIGLNQWLQRYPNHIALKWMTMVAPVVAVLAAALLVILFQTKSLAARNPVESLRHE